MTLDEIKEEVVMLPKAQRLELSKMLAALDPAEDEVTLLSRRMKAMDAGHYITLEDFKKMVGMDTPLNG